MCRGVAAHRGGHLVIPQAQQLRQPHLQQQIIENKQRRNKATDHGPNYFFSLDYVKNQFSILDKKNNEIKNMGQQPGHKW